MSKILIIEDSEGVVLSLSVAFKAAGHEPVVARDGVAGFELAKSERPDLIVLDLFLPQMDGFKVLEFLRHERSTEKIPVVVFSALSQEADLDQAKRLGATDYIVKANMSINDAIKRILEHLPKNKK